MAKSSQEVYEKGYSDGLRMAEQMRRQGTSTGDLLESIAYQPDKSYRAQYDQGFQQGLEDAVILREL